TRNDTPVISRAKYGPTGLQVPEENSTWPLYPFVLVHDTPFLLDNYGSSQLGTIGECVVILRRCKNDCDIRDKPLSPSDSPTHIVDGLTSSIEWYSLFDLKDNRPFERSTAKMVRRQALAALSSSNVISSSDWNGAFARPEADIGQEEAWVRIRDAVGDFELSWDVVDQCYRKKRDK